MQVFCTDELYHHGIKGQRWGIRRYQNPDGTLTAVGKRRYGTVENFKQGITRKKASKNRKEDVSRRRIMSNKELEDRIARLKLEKEYKSLSNEDVAPGKAAAAEIIGKSAKTVLSAAVAGGMAYALNYALNKKADPNYKVDWKEVAKFAAPNPNQKKK